MKKIRLISLLLVLVMCLSACAPAASQEQPKAPATETPQTTTPEKAENNEEPEEAPKEYWQMLDEVSDTSELPDWEGKPLEITLWKASGTSQTFGEDVSESTVWKEITRVTGVKLNINESFDNGGNNISAKLPQVIASGIYPTIVTGYNIDGEMKELYEHGYLLDLTEYYEKGYLDHLKANYGGDLYDVEVFSDLRDSEGNYYLYPSSVNKNLFATGGYENELFDARDYIENKTITRMANGCYFENCLYIRDDMLRELIPEALTYQQIEDAWMANGTFTEEQVYDTGLEDKEDFFELLRGLKELALTGEYVDATGTSVEVFSGPNSELDNWGWMTTLPKLVGGVGDSDSSYFSYYNGNPTGPDDLIKYGFTSDIYADFARELNKLVMEDVISQNSLVDNNATFKEKVLNGHYAVIYNEIYGTTIADLNAISEDWDYRPVYFKQAYNPDVAIYFAARGTIYTNGIFKDAVPEDQVEQLIHFIDYINSEIGIKNLYWGPRSAGLFVEDAEGNRSFATDELVACMINNENNGMNIEHGLAGSSCGVTPELITSSGIYYTVLDPTYAMEKERTTDDARKRYNPGILDGQSQLEMSTGIFANGLLYALGQNVEALAEFWSTRPAFEAQMTRAIASPTPEAFETEWQELLDMAEEAGATEEALKEFSLLFYEKNASALDKAGVLK